MADPSRTAWDHDTLDGRLLEWERPDERHLRQSFGYWNMVERRMVRALAGRDLTYSEENRAIEANHANDASFVAQCAYRRALEPRAPASLTAEEWAFLAEHFAGANDPTAQAIHAKAVSRIESAQDQQSIVRRQPDHQRPEPRR